MEKTTLVLKFKNWIINNRYEVFFLVFVLVLGAFFRLYKIAGYMTFLGDEGRDVIIVRRLLVEGDPILIGPGTSIGNMYLGPLYYYMMAPALAIAGLSPVGPAVMIALLGVLTIFFVWYVAREWFGKTAAAVASFFYAISPTVIIFSRSSWNPNIMPFFALLTVYSIWRVWMKKQDWWLIVASVAMAFVLQSHYLGLLLFPVLGLFWLLAYLRAEDKKKFRIFTLYGALVFCFLMSPLVIFDARHGWNNLGAIKKFFLERQTTVSARPWTALPKIPSLLEDISTRLVGGRNLTAGRIVLAVLTIPSIVLLLLRKKLHQYETGGVAMVLVWLAVALVGLGVYKQHIYDHYYGFFFAAPFLLLGAFVGGIFDNLSQVGKTILLGSLGLLAVVNFVESPLKYPPNRQLERAETVAEKIKEEAKGERYNLAVVAERNYEDGYQYFLEKWGEPVVEIDAQRADETITDQLFVVCELPEKECDPVHNPKQEVAGFGWSAVAQKWDVFGITLFKLVHTQ